MHKAKYFSKILYLYHGHDDAHVHGDHETQKQLHFPLNVDHGWLLHKTPWWRYLMLKLLQLLCGNLVFDPMVHNWNNSHNNCYLRQQTRCGHWKKRGLLLQQSNISNQGLVLLTKLLNFLREMGRDWFHQEQLFCRLIWVHFYYELMDRPQYVFLHLQLRSVPLHHHDRCDHGI